jgi:hypothetical protein
MQEGTGITTLAGTRNSIKGPIYLADGTLKIAPSAAFTVPPRLIIGVNDWRQAFPTLDISGIADGQDFVVSALETAGPQIQTGQVGTAIWFPIVNLGTANLVVGNGEKNNSKFIGGLIGTGSLVLAQNTFLDLGGVSAYYYQNNAPAFISTYSGGTKVSDGATLMLENLAATGTGPLLNAGSLQLGNSVQYLLQQSGLQSPPSATANPLHIINLPADYTQTATGSVTLRIAGKHTDGQPEGGAGSSYEEVDAAGAVSLSGTLNLRLINHFVPPRGGANFTVVRAGAGITGSFAQINVIDGEGSYTTQQHVTRKTVTVTITPN